MTHASQIFIFPLLFVVTTYGLINVKCVELSFRFSCKIASFYSGTFRLD